VKRGVEEFCVCIKLRLKEELTQKQGREKLRLCKRQKDVLRRLFMEREKLLMEEVTRPDDMSAQK
jgi:hypothetical protein